VPNDCPKILLLPRGIVYPSPCFLTSTISQLVFPQESVVTISPFGLFAWLPPFLHPFQFCGPSPPHPFFFFVWTSFPLGKSILAWVILHPSTYLVCYFFFSGVDFFFLFHPRFCYSESTWGLQIISYSLRPNFGRLLFHSVGPRRSDGG